MKTGDNIVITFTNGDEGIYVHRRWENTGIMAYDEEGRYFHFPHATIAAINPAPVQTTELLESMSPGETITLYRPDQPEEPHRHLIKGANDRVYVYDPHGIIWHRAEGWNNWTAVEPN